VPLVTEVQECKKRSGESKSMVERLRKKPDKKHAPRCQACASYEEQQGARKPRVVSSRGDRSSTTRIEACIKGNTEFIGNRVTAWTVGYSLRPITDFIDQLLHAHGIEQLIDVRTAGVAKATREAIATYARIDEFTIAKRALLSLTPDNCDFSPHHNCI
jgi:hypothetical protein